jgi:hypothetical protein
VVWTGLFWLRMGTGEMLCEQSNEPPGSKKVMGIVLVAA